MAKRLGRLKALNIPRMAAPGLYPDGGGLYLQVTVNAREGEPARSWVYRYMRQGKAREMGLGSLLGVSLVEARSRADICRRQRSAGIDPIEARRASAAQAALEAASLTTFRSCADAYLAAHKAAWRSAKHAAQWENTLATYAHSVIGELPVQAIDTGLVLKILESIWTIKPTTANRLRGRVETVLNWATARGYRKGENPARWKGHLENLLPKRSKVQRVVHYAAIPYGEIGDFMVALRRQESVAARALEFNILTAARTGETIGATWREIDLAAKTWTVPGRRIKAGKEHRAPLSSRALEILATMKKLAGNDVAADAFVFPGAKHGRSLSNMALLMLLRRMGREGLTVHGFRSAFRDWAAELTNFPREAAELALAHSVGDKVEAAYRRGDLFDKRRRLMAEWEKFCAAPGRQGSGNVTALAGRR